MDCNLSELISFLSKSKLHELDLGDCGVEISLIFTLCARPLFMKDGCNFAREDQPEKAR
jgi:hypothetical protein